MVFPVIGGDGKPTGYEIDNSLRVNHGDSPFLSRSISSTGNERTATVSVWVKRALFGTEHTIFSNKISSAGSNCFKFAFFNDDELSIQIGTTGNSNTTLTTNRKFRDPSAWYHLMAVIDTDQATEANRVRIYVNGEEETSFSDSGYPSRNSDMRISNSSFPHTIGEDPRDNTHFNGYLSEMYFIDGTALTPSSFGKTDDNGVWIPKDAKDNLTFGTNGFYMKFKQTGTSQNSSGIGADTSGNDNHFAVTNLAATDITTDTPTNNFAVINAVWAGLNARVAPTLTEGNTQVDHGTTDSGAWSTIIPANGKWYAEFKATEVSSNTSGISVQNLTDGEANWRADTYQNAKGYQFFMNGKTGNNGTSNTSYGSAWSANDIIGIAMDLDNGKLYFSVNGTYVDSGDPTSGSSGTGAAYSIDAGDLHCIGSGYKHSLEGQWNFGNPAFAISSGNADANGYGNFEYAVPSGYYALCTKNLAEYG